MMTTYQRSRNTWDTRMLCQCRRSFARTCKYKAPTRH